MHLRLALKKRKGFISVLEGGVLDTLREQPRGAAFESVGLGSSEVLDTGKRMETWQQDFTRAKKISDRT
jgi:hypothetical protein